MDQEYYRRRLGQEQSAADAATCETARRSHRALADHYAQMLQAASAVAAPAPVLPVSPAAKLQG